MCAQCSECQREEIQKARVNGGLRWLLTPQLATPCIIHVHVCLKCIDTVSACQWTLHSPTASVSLVFVSEQLTLNWAVVVTFSMLRRLINRRIIRPRRSRSAAAYSDQTFQWTICRSVRRSVCASVCPVHCGKMADCIRMSFGIVGRTRQVVGFEDRSMERGTFGGEFGTRHCKQRGLYGVLVRECRDAAVFPNYFAQTSYSTRCDYVSFGSLLSQIRPSVACLSVCNVGAHYSGG